MFDNRKSAGQEVPGSLGSVWLVLGFLVIGAASPGALAAAWQLAQEGMPSYTGLASDGWVYVSVGHSGDIRTSPDGATWTKRTNPDATLARLRGVAYGGGQFVAVGDCCVAGGGPVVLTSPFGTVWTLQDAAATGAGRLSKVAYGHGLYVAVGRSGEVITSPDGVTWTPRSSGTTEYLFDVAYGWGRDLFVAVGNALTLLTSPDGVNWTVEAGVPAGIPSSLAAVTYTGSQFVVVSRDPSGAAHSGAGLMTSPDGVSWTQRTVPTDQPLNSVAVGNGLIVAVGISRTILTSANGVDWTARTQVDPGPGVSPSLFVVAFGPGGFVAGGNRGNVFTSPDGVTDWVSQTLPTSRGFFGMAHDGVRYCAVGVNGIVASSPDGVTWTQQTALDHQAYFYWASLLQVNGAFWATGISDSIMSSPDCVTWTARYPAAPLGPDTDATGILMGIAYGNGLYVATGESYPAVDQAVARILTSPDGVTWTPAASGLAPTSRLGYYDAPVACGNGRFVTSLTDGTSGELFLLTSDDGTTWSQQTAPAVDPHEAFADVIYVNGLFVAAGDRIWTSPDGITWTLRLDYTGTYFQDIAHGTAGFVAVGWNGSIYSSFDGISWLPETGATPYHLYAVTSAVSGPRFVAAGISAIEYADDALGQIFADGFESGDVLAWSSSP